MVETGDRRESSVPERDGTQARAGFAAGPFAHRLFEVQAERSPEAVAALFQTETLTYRQLNARANQLAHRLIREGAQPETVVGLYCERSLEMLVGLLGILKAGAAYLPLDPSYPAELTAFMLEDAEVPLTVTQSHLLPRLASSQARKICLDSDGPALSREDTENPETEARPENLAYVIYTSGSTGKPKGVLVEHRSVVHSTEARLDYYAGAVEGFLLLSSPAFDSSVAGIFWTLALGGALWLPRTETQRDPAGLARMIAESSISHLLCVPSLYAEILRASRPGELDTLRIAIVAGEICPRELVHVHRKKAPQADLFNEYGPTEGTVWSTVADCRVMPEEGVVPIGRPIAGAEIHLLDTHGKPARPGTAGEIFLGGAGVARGYLNRASLTAEKFLPDPFRGERGARLYRSGDLARLRPDGNLEFLGRLDQQIKVRGFRIEPGQVEEALSSHPAVRECVVLAGTDVSGGQRLVAYFTAGGEPYPSSQDLRAFLRKKLPEQMVPSDFVALETFPRTPAGKVDRLALPAADPREPAPRDLLAPRTTAEAALAGIWREVLDLERVGPGDDFFSLGGHSLLATRVLSRVRELFGVELPLRSVYDAPTVAGLAACLEAALPAGFPSRPLRPVSREGDLPLSFAQQRLWFLDQLDEGKVAYNLPHAARFLGRLDVAALRKSLGELVRRHESLRTTFRSLDGSPAQTIAPPRPQRVRILDLSHLSGAEQEREALRLVEEEARQPFDLAQGPLFRATLVRLSEEAHLLLLTLHHIVSDGWSFRVLTRELALLYGAFARGEPSVLPEPQLHYADFAVWERDRLSGEVLASQLSYWKKQLAGPLPVLSLPSDRPRPPVQSFRGARLPVELPAELTRALREFSRKERASLFMTLLAAFDALLCRYTGEEDILVGTPIARRTQVETEGLIGFFVNTLVLRADLSGDPTFRGLLSRVRELALEAYAHQELPFEKLVEELQPERQISRSPLFQVLFVLEDSPDPVLALPGLSGTAVPTQTGTSKFDLALTLVETGGGLSGFLEYSADLFDAETMARLFGHFETLLAGIAEDPDRRLSRLPLMTGVERHRLLAEWNRTRADFPSEACLHRLFEVQAERSPEAVAALFQTETLTYRQLNARANQLAHRLIREGAQPETVVGLYCERSLEMLVGLLGILKAGAAYLPLDPSYPAELTAFMLEDAEVPLTVTQSHLLPRLTSSQARKICLDSEGPALSREDTENPETEARPENLAYVIYTSGSTGKPKGTMVSHRALVNYVSWCLATYSIHQGRGAPVQSSIAFDLTITSLLPPLLAGKSVFLLPEGRGLETLADALRGDHDFSLLKVTPTHLEALSELLSSEKPRGRVGVFVIGGEILEEESLLFWRIQAPEARFVNEYGPTETTVGCALYEVLPGDSFRGPVPIGHPIANTQLYILDLHWEPVAIGIAGELYVGGIGVGRGYWRRPELTAEKFLPDPYGDAPGARLYRTGDRARYRADGAIEFLGRLDQQVKIRGFRVEPGEVEAVLRQHPSVRESVVLAGEGAPGQRRLVAYVVGEENPAPLLEEIRAFARTKLPEYMVPSSIVVLERFPSTPGGKLDRLALPSPDPTRPEREEASEPRDEMETALAAMWTELLGLPSVGIRENFFDLGGHSLLAVRLFARIEREFGKKLPLATVFQAPTIERLAGILRQERWQAPWSSLVAIQPTGGQLPLYFMHPISGNVVGYYELARLLGPDQPVYGLQAVGLEEGVPPHTGLREMAAHYVREIRALQPLGPYHVGGFSFGGVVAFEVACQLHAQGARIGLVALFDTYCPAYSRELSARGRYRYRAQHSFARLAFYLKNLMAASDRATYLVEWFRRIRKRAKRKARQFLRRFPRPPGIPREVPTVYEANLLALKAYAPRIYPGRVTLFRARERDLETDYDPRSAWADLAADGLEVHDIPGKHARMLTDVLVERLRACLREAAGEKRRSPQSDSRSRRAG